GPLAKDRPDSLRLSGLRLSGQALPELRLQGRRCRERSPRGVVDDLRVNVLHAPENRQARTFRRPDDLAPNPVVPSQALLPGCFLCHNLSSTSHFVGKITSRSCPCPRPFQLCGARSRRGNEFPCLCTARPRGTCES